MALKSDGRLCGIREQTIEDPVSGLTFQFAIEEGTSAPIRLRIFGNLPNGNRELVFNADGEMTGAGTSLAASCGVKRLAEVG